MIFCFFTFPKSYNNEKAILAAVLLAACGGNGDQKSAKGNWAAGERTEFMRNCVASARQSYEARGQQPDSTTIITMRKCSGEIIEEKYAYADTDKMAAEEIKGIMAEAAEKCLKK